MDLRWGEHRQLQGCEHGSHYQSRDIRTWYHLRCACMLVSNDARPERRALDPWRRCSSPEVLGIKEVPLLVVRGAVDSGRKPSAINDQQISKDGTVQGIQELSSAERRSLFTQRYSCLMPESPEDICSMQPNEGRRLDSSTIGPSTSCKALLHLPIRESTRCC